MKQVAAFRTKIRIKLSTYTDSVLVNVEGAS